MSSVISAGGSKEKLSDIHLTKIDAIVDQGVSASTSMLGFTNETNEVPCSQPVQSPFEVTAPRLR